MKEMSCEAQPIEAFLCDELDDATRVDFEAHLAECEICQRKLTQSAAEPELWSEAIELLGGDTEVLNYTVGTASRNGSKRVLSVLDSLAPSDDPEMLGRLGEYEISGVIGIGGMGAVLKGYDRSLRRVVAIKVMAAHLADNGSARHRFQREARAAAAITHDNVIDIYGVSDAAGLPYLVMPFARGPSLQKRLDESGPMSLAEVLRIGRQIASGLAAAHEQGLVHRDIKPANILLNDGIERLWITDFGVARAMDDASMTQTGLIAGTPQYMSPEQARGEAVDHRSDLFSLGSILYTTFSGRPPFRAESAYGILRRITDTEARDIREINPDVPDWMCHIIERLMAKNPADRFESAEEVADLLEACLAHLQQPIQVALPDRLRQVSRRQPNHSGSVPSFVRNGVFAMVASLGVFLLLFQVTAAPDVSGTWKGDEWTSVTLEKGDVGDWYSGRVTDKAGRSGMLQLRWSRVQQRFNGQFQIGEGEFGDITFRRGRSGKLTGAVSLAAGASADASTPRLREFVWVSPTGEFAGDDVQARKLKGEVAKLAEMNSALREQILAQKEERDLLYAQTLELRDQLNQDGAIREELAHREQILRKLERELARLTGATDQEEASSKEEALTEELRVLEKELGAKMESAIVEFEQSRELIELNELKLAEALAKIDASAKDAIYQRRSLEKAVALEQAALATLADSKAKAQSQLNHVQEELVEVLRLLDSRLGHAQESAELNQKLYETAKKQLEAGDEPETTGLKAEAELLKSKQEIEQLKALIEYYHSLLQAMPSEAEPKPAPDADAKKSDLTRKLRVLEAKLKGAHANLQLAEQKLEGTEALAKEGIVSESTLSEAKVAATSAAAEVDRLRAEAAFLQGQKSAEAKLKMRVRMLEADLKTSAVQLATAERDLARMQVLAEEGIVTKAKLEESRANFAKAAAQMEALQAQAESLRQVSVDSKSDEKKN